MKSSPPIETIGEQWRPTRPLNASECHWMSLDVINSMGIHSMSSLTPSIHQHSVLGLIMNYQWHGLSADHPLITISTGLSVSSKSPGQMRTINTLSHSPIHDPIRLRIHTTRNISANTTNKLSPFDSQAMTTWQPEIFCKSMQDHTGSQCTNTALINEINLTKSEDIKFNKFLNG